ncbi:MAG TPA: hypothetical protein PLF38_08365 [Xylanibacter oryzae]|uniref:hypothetical protein n=1 Tax=Xylanibacter oryzae TaxID=185293 RepID=UPI0004AD9516|nr:hypothetical protein [Xylanibacter oryzae]HRN17043.1 hypothetical protein [Xylanibacter oryzae]
MYNNCHWLNDIIAGAGIGLLSTKLSYWIYPKLFKTKDSASYKNRVSFVVMSYYANNQYGCSAAIFF